MAFLNQQNELQTNFYAQLTHNSLQPNLIPDTEIVLRPIKSIHDSATQIINEPGTTDVLIGDITAEVMITTPGKIPNEMYYLEDTTPNSIVAAYGTELHEILNNNNITTTVSTIRINDKPESEHSTLLFILVTALFIILLMCCITACIIARSRSKSTMFVKRDMECSPECSGVNQPLLGLDKTSETTTKTSGSSTQN